MQRMAARAFHCLRLQSERSPTVVDKTGEGMEAGENGFLDQRAPAQVCAREEGHERGDSCPLSPSSNSFLFVTEPGGKGALSLGKTVPTVGHAPQTSPWNSASPESQD